MGVLRFGLEPDEVGRLSLKEFKALSEEWKFQKEMERDVVLNALKNSKRTKLSQKFIELFPKGARKVSREQAEKDRAELFSVNLFPK